MRWSRHEKTTLAMVAYRDLMEAADMMFRQLDHVLTPLGLTTAQYRTLEALFFRGPMNQTELSRLTFSSGSTVSVTVSTLAKGRLVTRRPDAGNRNQNVVAITRDGKRVLARVLPHVTKLVRALMAALGKREQKALARMCQKLAAGDDVKTLRELLATMRGK